MYKSVKERIGFGFDTSSNDNGPTEHCKFVFAVFGIRVNKRKPGTLWKILRERVLDNGGIKRAIDRGTQLSQKTQQEFNCTGAEVISRDDLSRIQRILMEHCSSILKINRMKSEFQKLRLYHCLIINTTQKINNFLPSINGKWLRYYGLVNSTHLLVKDRNHFIKIQNEVKKNKKCSWGRVALEFIIDLEFFYQIAVQRNMKF